MPPAYSGWFRAAKRNREWIAARRVLGADGVAAIVFEVVQEGGDEGGVQVGYVQLGRRPSSAFGGEPEQDVARMLR